LAFLELTLEDLEALLKGVAVPLRPLCVFDELLAADFFFDEEALEDGAEAAAVLFRLDLGGGVGVGDLDAAREELGVDKRDREELGVSERGSAEEPPATESKYFGFCTCLLDLGVDTGASSSKSMRRCVFERRLELVRPVMIGVVLERKLASVDHCTS